MKGQKKHLIRIAQVCYILKLITKERDLHWKSPKPKTVKAG